MIKHIAIMLIVVGAFAQTPSAPTNLIVGTSPILVGCGVGQNNVVYDQSTCGNYIGAAYEDLATASSTTPPAPTGSGTLHLIPGGACPAILVPTAQGDVFRLTGNIDDGVGGTNQNCIHFSGQVANSFVIDGAGFTLNGGIKCDQNLGGNDCSGITIVNFNNTCNIANGGAAGCLYFNLPHNPTKSVLITHNNFFNANSPVMTDNGYSGYEFALLIVTGGSTPQTPVAAGSNQKTFNGAGIELAHNNITNAYGYTGASYPTKGWCARCTDAQIDSAGGTTVEAWNNIINNGPYTDANQGLLCFNTSTCLMHNNYAPWVHYLGVQDTGRPFMFDAAGKPFNQQGGKIYNNLVEAYNNRCVRTRQVNNVQITNNRFEHVMSTTVDPCIMMGGNGDYAEKIDKQLVANNTFTMAGGTAIEAAESYGSVADTNTFLCDINCSTGILGAAWLAEGSNGLSYAITSAVRDSSCNVTLTLAYSPTTTSVIAGVVSVNVSGRTDDFNVSGTAGNILQKASGTTMQYVQAGCTEANTGTAGGVFWMAQYATDNYPSNGSQLYVKNSIIDPNLKLSETFVACGSANPACLQAPMSQQTEFKYCNNPKPVLGTGATAIPISPVSGVCP